MQYSEAVNNPTILCAVAHTISRQDIGSVGNIGRIVKYSLYSRADVSVWELRDIVGGFHNILLCACAAAYVLQEHLVDGIPKLRHVTDAVNALTHSATPWNEDSIRQMFRLILRKRLPKHSDTTEVLEQKVDLLISSLY
jgi:hypothetical protein